MMHVNSPGFTSMFSLEADSVVKRYGERLVLKAASLRVRSQAITALLGRNGMGKSTLLRILCGVTTPDAGSVRVDGAPFESFALSSLAHRGVFFLPDRDLLHPHLTVRVQLDLAARMRGDAATRDRLIELLGVSGFIDQKPPGLSGGERRRAEFAVALACRPRVFAADEPLRGIPPVDAELLLAALRVAANDGCAVVLTGHEVNLILAHVDHVTWCVAGTTREFASPIDATTDRAFRREFLGG